jgi:hypothetical protein
MINFFIETLNFEKENKNVLKMCNPTNIVSFSLINIQ